MRLRDVALASALAMPFAPGCGGKPAFDTEIEELEYLNALSNPTVEQFQKRKVLDEKHGDALDGLKAYRRAAGERQ